MNVDLIIENISELVTCASPVGPKRGAAMCNVGLIKEGAVAISGGHVAGVGTTAEMATSYPSVERLDAEGRVVCPGFVDPHTHIVFAGDRLDEFELKIKGADYLEILKSGGGIISTVNKTRAASFDVLVNESRVRLERMLACGTTSCEIKTGYGLDPQSEYKMLDVIAELGRERRMGIVPTFLAAHAVPPEHKDNPGRYVDQICNSMLAAAWEWFARSEFHGHVPFFCDVFCENGAFTLEQTQRILETARSMGYKLKAHVDEFSNLGGSRLCIGIGAVSIDHLDAISEEEIELLSRSNTIGVVTPTVNFNFGSTHFADARKLIDTGCAVALSTDFNPGSAPCPSPPMAMSIACRYQQLLPAEAINAATINAAHAIGIGDRVGSIESGKQADLLLLDTSDHRQIAYEFGGDLIHSVMRAGSMVRL